MIIECPPNSLKTFIFSECAFFDASSETEECMAGQKPQEATLYTSEQQQEHTTF